MGREPYKRVFQTNPELLEEMLGLRARGASFPLLAKKYGVDHTSIMNWCHKFNVSPRDGILLYKLNSDSGGRLLEKEIEEIIELRKSGLNYERIGAITGFSTGTIMKYCHKENLGGFRERLRIIEYEAYKGKTVRENLRKRSYAEYARADKKRKEKQLEFQNT